MRHQGNLKVQVQAAGTEGVKAERDKVCLTVERAVDLARDRHAETAKVQLEEGLDIIGHYAFKNCQALQEVTIPSSVTKLGCGAFGGCNDLAEVQFKEGSLQVVRAAAFCNCSSLQSVTIPSTVT